MDIIFQSGDFYSQSGFISTYIMPFLGIFIPSIIAVVLFNLGIKKERELDRKRRLLDREEEENRRITKILNFKDHYIILLKSCIEASQKQLTSYLNFAKEIKNNDYEMYVCQRYTMEDLTRINSFSSERVFEIFEMKGLISEYTRTVQQIDFLITIFKKVPTSYDTREGKLIRELSDQIYILREEILYDLVCRMNDGKRNGQTYLNNPTMEFYNKIMEEYHSNQGTETSIYYEYEMLFKPLSEELRKDKYLNAQGNDLLLKKLREARNNVGTIQGLNRLMLHDLSDSCNYIQSSIKLLQESYLKLNKEKHLVQP